jgi:hypothetical protein
MTRASGPHPVMEDAQEPRAQLAAIAAFNYSRLALRNPLA